MHIFGEFDWPRIARGDLDRRSFAAQNSEESDARRVQPAELWGCPKKCLARQRYGILILERQFETADHKFLGEFKF